MLSLSLRGKADFALLWQSRGSAHTNKVAFQRIATAPNVHVYWVIVSKRINTNKVPRNDIFFDFRRTNCGSAEDTFFTSTHLIHFNIISTKQTISVVRFLYTYTFFTTNDDHEE